VRIGAQDRADAGATPGASVAGATLRPTAGPATLVFAAIGGPRALAGKLARIGRTLRLWCDAPEIARRLATLERLLRLPTGAGELLAWLRALRSFPLAAAGAAARAPDPAPTAAPARSSRPGAPPWGAAGTAST
jgi:hypothetical protein